MLLVDLHKLIMPQHQIAVASLLAMIERQKTLVPSSSMNPEPALHSDAHTMGVADAKSQLQIAIDKSHGSDTAKWLTQTAGACLGLGLEASMSGLQLRPVSLQKVAAEMRHMFPSVKQLLLKLQGDTGQKYFDLFGPIQAPTTVLLKLHSIVLLPGKTASVTTLLQVIQIASGSSLSDGAVLLPASPLSEVSREGSAATKEAEAKHELKIAVQTQHAGSTDAAKITVAIASAAIELGLKTSSSHNSFVLLPVARKSVGSAIAEMKLHTAFASKSISDIITQLSLQQHFSFAADTIGDKRLTLHIASVLPHPNSAIRHLLPDAPWGVPRLDPTVASSSAPHAVSTVNSSEAPCSGSGSASDVSHTTRLTKAKQNAQGTARSSQSEAPLQDIFTANTETLQGDAANSAATTRRVAMVCTFGECNAPENAQAGVLHRIQVCSQQSCHSFDLQHGLLEPHMKGLLELLQDKHTVKVMHDCRQPAASLLYQKGITIQNVFDTQVVQGLLDHMHSVLNCKQHQQRRSLEELLFLYGIDQQTNDEEHPEAAESAKLLLLADALTKSLGEGGMYMVHKLSRAHCQWNLHSPDRIGAEKSQLYSERVRLPVNEDLEMTFVEEGSYKPTFTPYLCDSDEEQESSADKTLLQETESSTTADSVATILDLLPDAAKSLVLQHLDGGTSDTDQDHLLSKGHASREDAPRKMLIELVADKGRPLVIRFSDGSVEELRVCVDMTEAVAKLHCGVMSNGDGSADPFYADNRMGIEGTLHRISAIRNRDQQRSVIGLTYRIGRHMPGVAALMLDILSQLQSGGREEAEGAGATSLLLVGPPGVGKTTLLRDVVSLVANKLDRRVVVVDTSNEIGGDGAIPRACLGKARRMPVYDQSKQHEVLLQAVQNHNPQVVVVDEIGSSDEVRAVRSIAQRGVMLVGTAHGVSLRSLISNPELNTLVGGVHQVVVGDKLARDFNSGSKTKTERRGPPVFTCLVEVMAHDRWRVHPHVASSVDALLAGRQPNNQLRMHKNGKLVVRFETDLVDQTRCDQATLAAPSSWLASLGSLAQSLPEVDA